MWGGGLCTWTRALRVVPHPSLTCSFHSSTHIQSPVLPCNPPPSTPSPPHSDACISQHGAAIAGCDLYVMVHPIPIFAPTLGPKVTLGHTMDTALIRVRVVCCVPRVCA